MGTPVGVSKGLFVVGYWIFSSNFYVSFLSEDYLVLSELELLVPFTCNDFISAEYRVSYCAMDYKMTESVLALNRLEIRREILPFSLIKGKRFLE